jgi:hypothetical protein
MEPKMTQVERGKRARIKIALLDTGIREAGSSLETDCGDVMQDRLDQGFPCGDRNPIKAEKCFTSDNTMDDSCGHGTQLACLLLQYAPDADLYIAKVSSTMKFEVGKAVADVSSLCPFIQSIWRLSLHI